MPPKCQRCNKDEARTYTCQKTGEKKYRTTCTVCAAKQKERNKKRRKRKLEANPHFCIGCLKRNRVQGRKNCQTCLDNKKKLDKDPTSFRGMLYQKWIEWKRTHACVRCGYTGKAIQADHIVPETKLRGLSRVKQFKSLKKWENEAKKCQPLCAICHHLKTKDEQERETQPSTLRNRAILNAEKHKRGCCSTCRRPVEEDEERCFVFRKIDKKKSNVKGPISQMVHNPEAKFNRLVGPELINSKMLCQNCFWEQRS